MANDWIGQGLGSLGGGLCNNPFDLSNSHQLQSSQHQARNTFVPRGFNPIYGFSEEVLYGSRNAMQGVRESIKGIEEVIDKRWEIGGGFWDSKLSIYGAVSFVFVGVHLVILIIIGAIHPFEFAL